MLQMLIGVGIYLLGVATGVGVTLLVLLLLDKSYKLGHQDAE